MIQVFLLLLGLSVQQISQITNYQVMEGTLIDIDQNDKIVTLVSAGGMLEQLPMDNSAKAFNSLKAQISWKASSLQRGNKVSVVIDKSNRIVRVLYSK